MAKRTKTSTKTMTATAATSLPTVQAMVAGIDIGSSQHWVCGPARGEDGKPAIRSFGTTTVDLGALADWLVAQGTKSAAMESTSVYWIPLYELLESRGIEPVLVNARQLHNVPGRKTDVSDCQWLQLLHSHGLLRGSFRPSEAISRLRALQRQMGNLVAERSRCVQWMQKSLDQMNVQVHRAVTDLTGKTGMAIVRAIIAGERDPARLAVHLDGSCPKSADEIARYLTGHRCEATCSTSHSRCRSTTCSRSAAVVRARRSRGRSASLSRSSGNRNRMLVPSLGSDVSVTAPPPSIATARSTASPTPRPDVSLTSSRVENPSENSALVS